MPSFLGTAGDVKQVTTITLGGTPALNDEVTVSIYNEDITVEFDVVAPTLAQAAAAVAAAINASDLTSGLIVSETRSRAGQTVGLFKDVEASSLNAVITLKSRVAGVPFGGYTGGSVAASKSGSVTIAAGPTTGTNATGKKWIDNAENYSGGAIPTAGQYLDLNHGDFDILYGFDGLNARTILRTTDDWTGNLGLPLRRPDGTPEPLTRFPLFDGGATSAVHEIGIPTGNTPQGRCYVDFGTNAWTALHCYVYNSPRVQDDGHAVQLVGGTNLQLYVHGGSVAVGTNPSQNTTTMLNYVASYQQARTRIEDINVLLGSSLTGTSFTGFNVQGGTTTMQNSAADNSGLSNIIAGGKLRTHGTVTLQDVEIYEGGILENSGTMNCNTLEVFPGGTLDQTRAVANSTIASTKTYHRGSKVHDPLGRVTGAVVYNGTWPGDPDNDHSYIPGKTWTPS